MQISSIIIVWWRRRGQGGGGFGVEVPGGSSVRAFCMGYGIWKMVLVGSFRSGGAVHAVFHAGAGDCDAGG